MNKNINNYNEKEVKNKLKNFREGKDYSVLHEGEKKVFNFHNNFLRDAFGNDYTTIYEVAESWDSDNFNHTRAAAEYENDKSHVTYRYEHKINKDASGYREWSWSKNAGINSEIGWGLSERPKYDLDFHNFFGNDFLGPIVVGNDDEVERNRKYLAEFQEKKHFWEMRLIEEDNPEHCRNKYGENWLTSVSREEVIRNIKASIRELEMKIQHEKNWLAKNDNVSHRPDWINCPVCNKTFNKNAEVWGVNDEVGFQPTCCHGCAENFQGKEDGRIIKSGSDEYFGRDPQQRGRIGRNEPGKFVTDNEKDNYSDLKKENKELKKQLSKVKNQLKEVLEELKKLRNSGQGNAELDQQIDYNERIIRHDEEVPEVEIKEQVKKSQELLNKVNSSVVPANDNKKGNGALPYVIGVSVILAVAGIIGYYLLKKKKGKKVA